MKKAKKPVIQINPREPLTRKARAGIETYAFHRCGEMHIAGLLIKFTLEGERMKREKLYQWLEAHGYQWSGSYWHMATKRAGRLANNDTKGEE